MTTLLQKILLSDKLQLQKTLDKNNEDNCAISHSLEGAKFPTRIEHG